ncbi:Protein-glutamate methylesterase/protein-glutamine glutaminase [subsurface metagenome]
MKDNPISVLIVDDSALIRNLVSRMFDDIPDIQVIGKAMNGRFALQKLKKMNPDIIILDLQMPEMNGIEFLKERKKRGIEIPVVILSAIARKGAKITMEALSLGASDFVLKPSGSATRHIYKTKDRLVDLIKIYGSQFKKESAKKAGGANGAPSSRLQPSPPQPVAAKQPATQQVKARLAKGPGTPVKRSSLPIEIIAIGISTGGPNALRGLFPMIRSDLSVPILVVQHMPAGFTEEFAKSLDQISPLEVKEAADGDIIQTGRILIAPGDKHLEILDKPLAKIVRLSEKPEVNGHRPSADVLFASILQAYGGRSMAIIMTGMGRDGVKGIGAIYRAGGLTIAQDEASCIVFGMPRVAIDKGYIHKVLTIGMMAEIINQTYRESG